MSRPEWWTIDPRSPFTLGPRVFPGRIWTAAGCFAYGLAAHGMHDAEFVSPYVGLGAVVTKTITSVPRVGNPMPRLAEQAHGALNSIGLENVGLAAFIDEILPRLAEKHVPIVVSLAATRPKEFVTMVELLAAVASRMPDWHGVELNLSCPNVAEGGHDFGRDPEIVAACVAAAREHLPDRALLVKLTPNVANIAPLAVAARDAGADAVSAINTLIGLDVDLATGRPILPRRCGGYSGPALLPVALAKVDEIVREAGIPVVGVGGISSPEDALKFFALGCVAVQVGTAMMRDPFSVARIAARLGE